jgi:NADH-quinone oxidoreductase subunit N
MLVSRAKPDGDYQLGDYQGLATSNPLLAAAMTLFMVSLSGIPPTAGFFGKLYVFSAAVKAGLVPLVIIAVLNSAVSVFYYLRIVVYMYMKSQPVPLKLRVAPAMAAVLLICALGIAKFGIFPGDLMRWAESGVARMTQPPPTALLDDTEDEEVAAIVVSR